MLTCLMSITAINWRCAPCQVLPTHPFNTTPTFFLLSLILLNSLCTTAPLWAFSDVLPYCKPPPIWLRLVPLLRVRVCIYAFYMNNCVPSARGSITTALEMHALVVNSDSVPCTLTSQKVGFSLTHSAFYCSSCLRISWTYLKNSPRPGTMYFPLLCSQCSCTQEMLSMC